MTNQAEGSAGARPPFSHTAHHAVPTPADQCVAQQCPTVPGAAEHRARKTYAVLQAEPSRLACLGVHLLFAFFYLIPQSVMRIFAKRYGPRLLLKRQRRRQIVEANLRICFPDLDEADRALMRDNFARKLVFSMQSSMRLWWGTKEKLRQQVRIEGAEYLDAARAGNRPIILLVPHTVGLEIGGLALAVQYPMLGLTSEPKSPLKRWIWRRLRSRYADRVLDRAMPVQRVLAELKAGRILYYLPDQDHGHLKNSFFVPFFGQSTCTMRGTGRLLALTQPILLPCVTLLNFESGRYTIRIFPPVPDISHDANENCQIIRRELERLIRLQPEDYCWTLRIFNNQPDGTPNSNYPPPSLRDCA